MRAETAEAFHRLGEPGPVAVSNSAGQEHQTGAILVAHRNVGLARLGSYPVAASDGRGPLERQMRLSWWPFPVLLYH